MRILLGGLLLAGAALAQTTAFTYQGKLSDAGNPATGSYDMQFKLFDALSGGAQQGTIVTLNNVAVTAGIFTVQLDFGACPTCFDGPARFLEIAVKKTTGATFTILAPRQPITSAPYAVRSAIAASADTATDAAQLGGLPASGFIQYTTSQQAATNFNISGNGTVGGNLTGNGTLSLNIVNATAQYNCWGRYKCSVSALAYQQHNIEHRRARPDAGGFLRAVPVEKRRDQFLDCGDTG